MKKYFLFIVCIPAVVYLSVFAAGNTGNKPNAEKNIRTGADQVKNTFPC